MSEACCSVIVRRLLSLTLCGSLALAGCGRKPATAAPGPSAADAALQKATAHARRTVQDFIVELATARPDYRYLVKVRVAAQGHTQDVWLEPVRYENGDFHGPISNALLNISEIKKGDPAYAPANEITDWVILDQADAVIAGGYTLKDAKADRSARSARP